MRLHKPLICIPFTGTCLGELLGEASLFRENRRLTELCDIAEWRADYYGGTDYGDVLKALKSETDGAEIIFTFRSKEEGGVSDIPEGERLSVILETAKNRVCDYIDVELSAVSGKNLDFGEMRTIISVHDFEKTPGSGAIIELWEKAVNEGAFAVKGAFMPKNPLDVLNVLTALVQWRTDHKTPVIAISMGEIGKITRAACLGSWLTYAVLKTDGQSAPGQTDARLLREFLNNGA
jgi:3-dehydroquinate dehydratase-1